MLHATLAGVLLAAPPAPPLELELLDRLAPGSQVLVRMDDIGALMRSEDPGAFLGLLADPEVQRAIPAMLQELEAENDALGEDVLALARACGSGVALRPATGGFYASLQETPELRGRLLEFLRANGLQVETDARLGEFAVDLTRLGDGAVFVLHAAAERIHLALGTPEEAEVALQEFLPRHGLTDPAEGWWREAKSSVEDPLVEAYIDMGGLLAEDEPRIREYVGVAYLGLSACRDNACESIASLEFGKSEGLRAIAAAARPASGSLIALAPHGVVQHTVVAFDLPALLEGILAFAEELEPGSGQMVSAALEAGTAAIGVSVVDDVIPSLTGDIALLEWPDGLVAEAQADLSDDVEPEQRPVPTVVVGITDSSAAYSILDALENVAGLTFDVEETATFDVSYTTEAEIGVDLAIGIGEEYLVIGPQKRVWSIVRRVEAVPQGAGMVDAATREAIGDEAWVSIKDVTELWDVIGTAVFAAMEGEDDAEAFLELASAVLNSLSGRMSGTSISSVDIGPDRIVIREFTR